MSRVSITLMLCFFTVCLVSGTGVQVGAEISAQQLLKQAQSQSDSDKKIQLLDLALSQQNVRNELLSHIFYERGSAHKNLGECFRAIEDFDSSMAHSRRPSNALLEKAHCLIMLDQLDEAKRMVDMFLNTRSGSGQVYVLKGIIFEKQGFLSKAEDEYTRALAFEPNNLSALDLRAKVFLRSGKPRKALEDLDKLALHYKNNFDVIVNRARTQAKLNHFAEALLDYNRAETIDPNSKVIPKEKVDLFFKANQPMKALEAVTAFLIKNPEDFEALVLQAKARVLLHQREIAEKILRAAMLKNPAYAPIHLHQAVIYGRDGDYDRALESLNKAIELDPSLVEAYQQRAAIFDELQDNIRALSDFTTALELDPSDGETYVQRAAVYMKRRLYDAAAADYGKALELMPGDPKILLNRAVAFLNKNEPHSALVDLNVLVQSGTTSSKTYSLRGVAQFALGAFKQAREDFDDAVAMNPRDPAALNNRGFFFLKQHNFQNALADFRRALELAPSYHRAVQNIGFTLDKIEMDKELGLTAR